MSEMEPIGDEVEMQRSLAEREPDSYLPAFLVDAQEKLGTMSPSQLAGHFADVVIAVALRRPGWTPRRVLEEFAKTYPMGDAAWHGGVREELLGALKARGVVPEILAEDDGG